MIAVSASDFEKYGCVNCGCDFCYATYISGPATPLTCGECKTQFVVLNDELKISPLGFRKKDYDGLIIGKDRKVNVNQFIDKFDEIREKLLKVGAAVEKNEGYVYPIVGSHPRKGISKHKFVRPDIRPENGIGEFCTPRGVGYDLACFVKSKEAGQRITDMINRINEEYGNKCFSCWLDYREYEPLWIQVKIQYPNEEMAHLLAKLIHENGDIITEDIVREAIKATKCNINTLRNN